MTVNLAVCPQTGCTQQAEIVEEQLWPSTSGGVFMAKVVGVCGHWFFMPAWQVDLAGYANGLPLAS